MDIYSTVVVDLDSLIPYPDNPKNHDDEQIALLAGRIAKEGFNQPIVVDENNVIVKGHGRRLAAQKLNLKKVPVVVLEGLSPAEVKAARLADNQIPIKTDYDQDKMKLELEGLVDLDIDLDGLGFEDIDLDNDIPNFDPTPEDEQPRLDKVKLKTCPSCGYEYE